MTTKERLQAELEHLSEDNMAELLRVIQSRGQTGTSRKPSLMSRLRQVQIDAPEDFAANLAKYTGANLSRGLLGPSFACASPATGISTYE